MAQRLIDANALDWVDIEEEYGARTEEVVACEVLIEDAPTVDAIPVEWIERYMESVGRIGYVEVMLDDWKAEQWRKENEQIGFNN